jgi:hypothetical protein
MAMAERAAVKAVFAAGQPMFIRGDQRVVPSWVVSSAR